MLCEYYNPIALNWWGKMLQNTQHSRRIYTVGDRIRITLYQGEVNCEPSLHEKKSSLIYAGIRYEAGAGMHRVRDLDKTGYRISVKKIQYNLNFLADNNTIDKKR